LDVDDSVKVPLLDVLPVIDGPVNPNVDVIEPVTVREPVIIALPVNGKDEAFAT
jgi:hypothetical protein